MHLQVCREKEKEENTRVCSLASPGVAIGTRRVRE
jgi:hypothetical protein